MIYEVTANLPVEADSESGAGGLVADALSPLCEDGTITIGDGDKILDEYSIREFREREPVKVFVVQSRDGAEYVRVFATAEKFLEIYDADYIGELDEAEATRLKARYRAAVERTAFTGDPEDLGDGDTVTCEEVKR